MDIADAASSAEDGLHEACFLCLFDTVVDKLSDALITLSIVSVLVNLYGWSLWLNYLPVESYNNLIMALYLIAIFFLLGKDCAHDYSRINQRHRWLRLLVDKCGVLRVSLFKKAGT